MDGSHSYRSLEEEKYAQLKRLFEDEDLSHAARTFCARLIVLYGPNEPISLSSRELARQCFVATGHVVTVLRELGKNGKHILIERVGTGTWAMAHISLLPPTQVTSTPHTREQREVVDEQAGNLGRGQDLCLCEEDQ